MIGYLNSLLKRIKEKISDLNFRTFFYSNFCNTKCFLKTVAGVTPEVPPGV